MLDVCQNQAGPIVFLPTRLPHARANVCGRSAEGQTATVWCWITVGGHVYGLSKTVVLVMRILEAHRALLSLSVCVLCHVWTKRYSCGASLT